VIVYAHTRPTIACPWSVATRWRRSVPSLGAQCVDATIGRQNGHSNALTDWERDNGSSFHLQRVGLRYDIPANKSELFKGVFSATRNCCAWLELRVRL
jgi:hypothetical protein